MLKLYQVSVENRLYSVDAIINKAKQIHLIGPNGAGKSTLLLCLAGLLSIRGEIIFLDRRLSEISYKELAQLRGYFQQNDRPTLLMPVFQYLSLYQPPFCNREQLEEVLFYLLKHLSLEDKLSYPIGRLSGGEWQKVRLTAIFLQTWPTLNPKSHLLLLDEPMNHLDPGQQAIVRKLLSKLVKLGCTVIISGHDIHFSAQYADEVWLMSGGKVILQGSPNKILTSSILSQLFNTAFTHHKMANKDFIIAADLIG